MSDESGDEDSEPASRNLRKMHKHWGRLVDVDKKGHPVLVPSSKEDQERRRWRKKEKEGDGGEGGGARKPDLEIDVIEAGGEAAANFFDQTGIVSTPPRLHDPSCRAVRNMISLRRMKVEVQKIEWERVCNICKYKLEAATKGARPAVGAAASASASGSGEAGLLL